MLALLEAVVDGIALPVLLFAFVTSDTDVLADREPNTSLLRESPLLE